MTNSVARLTIHLFGAPEVQIDGPPIALNIQKARGLLLYLAATGQPHAVTTLFLFYGASLLPATRVTHRVRAGVVSGKRCVLAMPARRLPCPGRSRRNLAELHGALVVERGNVDRPLSTHNVADMLQVQGVHHVTFVGSNRETIIEFYQGRLGMRLVIDQPNLEVPHETHLYLDPGDGRLITYVVRPNRVNDPTPNPEGIGNLHHIAFNVSRAVHTQVAGRLKERGI